MRSLSSDSSRRAHVIFSPESLVPSYESLCHLRGPEGLVGVLLPPRPLGSLEIKVVPVGHPWSARPGVQRTPDDMGSVSRVGSRGSWSPSPENGSGRKWSTVTREGLLFPDTVVVHPWFRLGVGGV